MSALITTSITSSTNISSILLEVKAQNAGVLISSNKSHIIFKFFKLSPNNKSAMFKGRLVCSFLGLAASILITRLQDKGLQNMLANTLAKIST